MSIQNRDHFLIGAKDDIMPLTPYKKIRPIDRSTYSGIFKANIKITSFYGIYGIETLPEWMSILFSIFANPAHHQCI
ncbi:MAG: hypothetical protein IPN29_01770 [Saprospiraceae bacterium]|nr:hypothetical protein [Saprospiraceae bacterium]